MTRGRQLALLLVGSLNLLGSCAGDESLATTTTEEIQDVGVAGLHAAVAPSVRSLLAQGSIEILQLTTFDDLSIEVLWVDLREDGDHVVATRTVGENNRELAISVGAEGFQASHNGVWQSAVPLEDPIGALMPDVRAMTGLSYFETAADETFDPEILRSALDDGGSVWSISGENPDWLITESWQLDVDGALNAYTYARTVIPMAQQPSSEPPPPRPELIEVTFEVTNPASPIVAPTPGDPFDPSVFDLPGLFTDE